MAHYIAYLDTSGDQSRTAHGFAMVTVGLLGSEAQWARLSSAWRALLVAHGLEFLHMRAISQSFPGDAQAQDRFLKKAVRLLRKYTTKSFVTSLIPYEYSLVNEEYNLDALFRSEFGCVVGSSTMLVRGWFEKQFNPNSVHTLEVFHEAGDRGKGAATEVAERHGFAIEWLPASSPEPARSAFEAADFVAWEIRRVLEEMLQQKNRDPRAAVVEITHNLTKEVHMWNREHLLEMCAENSISRRQKNPLVSG